MCSEKNIGKEKNSLYHSLGSVSGFVEGMTPNSRISGQCFKNAHIRINGVSRQSYTSFELTMFYYKDSEIFLDKGDMIYV